MVLLALGAFLFFNQRKSDRKTTPAIPVAHEQPQKEDFKVYNNPYSDKVIIVFDSKDAGQGLIYIYNADGRLLGRKQIIINKGPNTWEYYFPTKARGMFVIRLATKAEERMTKIQKLM